MIEAGWVSRLVRASFQRNGAAAWNTRQNVAIKTFQCFGETFSQSEGATRPSFPARTTHIQTYIINGILKLSHKSRKCLENV